MDHVAIMNPKWGLIAKILSGEKQIESRWYMSRKAPWDRIHKKDTLYFKNAGQKVTAKATVTKVLQYPFMQPLKVKRIIKDYGGKGKIALTNKRISYDLYKHKKNCILIFLKDPVKIKPFSIDKRGYGIGSAWLVVGDIKEIKR